jgi:hypothetical protein
VVSKPGTTGEEAVQRLIPKATYETADTEIEGAMRVLEGTADAFVYDFPFNAVFRALHPSNQLVFLDEPFTEEPIAWAIRKNDPDFMKFLNDFWPGSKPMVASIGFISSGFSARIGIDLCDRLEGRLRCWKIVPTPLPRFAGSTKLIL